MRRPDIDLKVLAGRSFYPDLECHFLPGRSLVDLVPLRPDFDRYFIGSLFQALLHGKLAGLLIDAELTLKAFIALLSGNQLTGASMGPARFQVTT